MSCLNFAKSGLQSSFVTPLLRAGGTPQSSARLSIPFVLLLFLHIARRLYSVLTSRKFAFALCFVALSDEHDRRKRPTSPRFSTTLLQKQVSIFSVPFSLPGRNLDSLTTYPVFDHAFVISTEISSDSEVLNKNLSTKSTTSQYATLTCI